MAVRFHPHAQERMRERGAAEDEVRATLEQGEQFPAKFGRTGFRRNFPFDNEWHGRRYRTEQVETMLFRKALTGWSSRLLHATSKHVEV